MNIPNQTGDDKLFGIITGLVRLFIFRTLSFSCIIFHLYYFMQCGVCKTIPNVRLSQRLLFSLLKIFWFIGADISDSKKFIPISLFVESTFYKTLAPTGCIWSYTASVSSTAASLTRDPRRILAPTLGML